MKIMCLKKTQKKRRSIGKECILHIENSKMLRFPEKSGATCETPFHVLFWVANFVKKKKTSISGPIRVLFGIN